MENNIKIALIEHRTGILDQIPESLNQSEIGFAYDENRLFIGNPNNKELALRTTFPYQNVEILTEFSELHNYIKYRYVNNFEDVDGETSREKLIERVPLVISCEAYQGSDTNYSLTINGVSFSVNSGLTITEFADLINAQYETTKTSVFVNSKNQASLIFVCTKESLEIYADEEVIEKLGLPHEIDEMADELPERKLSEKLDDMVHITDFGIKPSSNTDVSEEIMKACVGIYNKFKDVQTHRRIFFPAGTYQFSDAFDSFYSLPLLTGTTIYGEGANNTVFECTPSFANYTSQIMNSHNQYVTDDTYTSEIVSNIYVHDVSFNTDGGLGSVYLRNAQNVIFENVTFKGNNVLITITADSSTFISSNIKFINCVFIGGDTQVYIEKNVVNVLFEGCRFETPNDYYVKIGDNNTTNANITKIIFNNNVFTGLDSGQYVNYVGGQSKYVSFTNSQFDNVVVERQSGHPIPFNPDFNYSERNYTDTLDITTDPRKILRFKFTQPKWDYLNQLIDPSGILLFNVRRDEDLEESDHTFVDLQVTDDTINASVQGTPENVNVNIENSKGSISVNASDDFNLSSNKLTVNAHSDVSVITDDNLSVIVAGETGLSSTGSITLTSTNEINFGAPTNFGGTIDLQNSNITNSMNGDITINTINGQIVKINDNLQPSERTYGERAIDYEDGVVTSSMLQRFQSSVHGFASYQNITTAGNVSLYDCSKYHTDNFILKELDVNFIIPPEFCCVNCIGGFPYIHGYYYPKNTILYLNGNQYIATTGFIASKSTDISVDAIGAYLTSQQPFYDAYGTVINVPTVQYDSIRFYDGNTGYWLVNEHDEDHEPEFIGREESKDYELNGHKYYGFIDKSENTFFIKDLDDYLCSANDRLSIIYEENVIHSSEPIIPFNSSIMIDTFDTILISNDDTSNTSYYVLGRRENINETYSLACYPFNNKITNNMLETFDYNKQYNTNDMFTYEGITYVCIDDTQFENIIMEGYKIIQIGTGLFEYAYKGSDGVIYANKMDTSFFNYPVYNSDGTLANDDDKNEFHDKLDEENINSIFDGTSTQFTTARYPTNDYVYKNEFYEYDEEKAVRILNPDKFKRLDVKGTSYSFTGMMGVYETTDEKSSDVISSVNLEELNLKNCVIAVRFFNKNGDHITEFTNSEQLESLKIGFFIEGIR